MLSFRQELEEALNDIWPSKADGQEGDPHLNASTWAERMEEKKRERESAVKAIQKPALTKEVDSLDLSILHI